jgi:hypothetical protein
MTPDDFYQWMDVLTQQYNYDYADMMEMLIELEMLYEDELAEDTAQNLNKSCNV